MIRILCDRCGADISNSHKIGYIAWNFKEFVMGDLLQENAFENKHYCSDCMNQIHDFISHKAESLTGSVGAFEPADDEIPSKDEKDAQRDKEKAKTADKNEPKRKRVDHGKIRALKNAGWSNKDIADEMHMTPGAVANSLSTHKELIEELKRV